MLGLYGTRIKLLLRNRSNVFWTFLFPILLATLFSLAFSNLSETEAFHSIPIGVIENNAFENYDAFLETASDLRTSEDDDAEKLFTVTVLNEKEAEEYLKEEKIVGYVYPDEEMELTVKDSNIEETILKSFLDTYTQTSHTVESLIAENPQNVQGIVHELGEKNVYTEDTMQSDRSPDYILNYYYALIAMACLFGCFWGLSAVTDIQANLSVVGARINVAPTNKLKLLLCNLLAALTVHLIGILLLLAYLMFVLKVDFGNDMGYILLTCLTSSVLGISIGSMFGAVSNKDINTKSSILSGVIMFSCFLAGLMMMQMKYIVSVYAPFLQYINPAHIITDAFYSLYYYETKERFFLNIGLMVAYSVVFSVITYLTTRRKKYASI